MSPRPVMPDDEIEYVNAAGIHKKRGKSGNSQKRSDYFMRQRFPFLEPLAEEDREKPEKAKKARATPEDQQKQAAPLARTRMEMMREYQKRLLAQQQEPQRAERRKGRGQKRRTSKHSASIREVKNERR